MQRTGAAVEPVKRVAVRDVHRVAVDGRRVDDEATGHLRVPNLMAGVGFGPLWSLRTSLAVWCTAAVVFPILTFRFSRGVWTAIVHLTGGVY